MEPRNDPGGTEAAIEAILEARRGAVMYDQDTDEIDTELEARGYVTERAKAAQAREKAAAKESVTTGSDEHRMPPNGRRTRPQSRG